ncbi:lysozyme inhibitor LprI family protein [Acinetobacter shaoyimingii]|uniref:DUF1311 domain-containing protein n=1 Tax=Acinetobacter shaoyimingii TaxID=2715164 RepID=A0A6G8RYM5_9GAMM|nr:lysozyme inhibitor LprI family protein [Acinetobacter shaoyimingii]NHB58012.1 DUF1311 domain-containing protein [Acinetobacter shaoyimingii]QIO06971.1 DUF1311 domain-containing protein [Acinetobacter shaoyimingii]
MKQLYRKLIPLLIVFFTQFSFAHTTSDKSDLYDQCVDHTLQKLKLDKINNTIVQSCSNETKAVYEKQIITVLDKIRQESQQESQPDRYLNILKSQRLWKSYVDKECDNAGTFIGSPMYSYCPMQEYRKRVDQLREYVDL